MDSPDIVLYRKPILAARLGSRALRKERSFSCLFGNTQKAEAFGALNIRGILTPACALAQNDRSV